ncbi:ABC transporter permease [Hydrogenophaga sp.]|uniref:ABC transporter permease n=1 Tax=Hydrogenophaga sp. TaxID=1904254 RepID=UPI003F6EF387
MNAITSTQALPQTASSEALQATAWPVRAVRKGFELFRRLLLVFGIVLAWEVASRAGWINPQSFPAPSAIGSAMAAQLASGDLLLGAWASLSRVFIGVSIASALGIALGALLARFDRVAFYVSPIVELVRPISVIAWIPVAIIWFGLGDEASWFIIALGAFFPVFTNTYSSVSLVPRVYLQAAQTLGLGRRLLLTQVLLPAALPGVLAGVRIGLGVGWMCVIAAEMISATSGLGYMIQTARILIETELVFAGMIVIGVVGFAMNWLMLLIGRRLTPWLERGH